MNSVHQPSRAQAIFFLFVTLALAIFIVAWVFFINKGLLAVNGEFPFAISVAGQTVPCSAAPCSIKLAPQTYSVTITKDGFYPDTESVQISRGAATAITPHFAFIPTIEGVGRVILPVDSAPLRAPFVGVSKLEKFPREAKDAVFSASGNSASLSLGKEFYIYDAQHHMLEKASLKPETPHAWTGDNLIVLADSEKGQVLQLINPAKLDFAGTVVSFERPFKNPQLIGDQKGEYVVIDDAIGEAHAYYLVDIKKQTRTRLAVSPSVHAMKWSLSAMIFEEGTEDNRKIFTMNSQTFEQTSLAAAGIENVSEIHPDVWLFVAAHKQDQGAAKIGPAIDEVLQQTFSNATDTWYITESDRKKNAVRTLGSVSAKEEIHRLTADLDGKTIYFEKGGKLFKIIIDR